MLQCSGGTQPWQNALHCKQTLRLQPAQTAGLTSGASLSRRSSGMAARRGGAALAAGWVPTAGSEHRDLAPKGVQLAKAANAAPLPPAAGVGEATLAARLGECTVAVGVGGCMLCAGLSAAGLAPPLGLRLPKSRARTAGDCSSAESATIKCLAASLPGCRRYAESSLKRWKPVASHIHRVYFTSKEFSSA